VIFEGPKAPPTVKGRVVRCQVSAIAGGGSLQYQSAIQFETKIDVPVDEASLPQQAAPAAAPPPPKTAGSKKQAEPTSPPKLVNRW
jgi:hypothetical protein